MPINRFAITSHRGVITSPILNAALGQRLTVDGRWEQRFELTSRDALELAAWLVCMAECNAVFYGGVDVEESAIAADPIGELARIVAAIRCSDDDAPAPFAVTPEG